MQVMHRYLTEAEQGRLLGKLKPLASILARRDRAWIDLLRNTGLRIGEFSLITVKQAKLALAGGWLFIPKEHRKGWNRKPRKDGKAAHKPFDHLVRVTELVREDLQALLAIQAEMGGSGAEDEPLVWSQKGDRMSVRSYEARFKFWCRQCGIDATPHWLRHTRAMNIMRKSTSNDPRGIVQGALGHAVISSTGIYTRISKEELAQQLDQVDGGRRMKKDEVRAAYEGRAA